MDLDDLPPRPDSPLRALAREDLEPFSVAALNERIAALRTEIGRAEAAIKAKTSTRVVAEALFRKNN
ncbi:MAG: DUF1192 domain-containing protein [Pseudomonadota bacterium]